MAETMTLADQLPPMSAEDREIVHAKIQKATRLGIDFVVSDDGCWWKHKNCDYQEGPFYSVREAVEDAITMVDGVGR